MGLGLNFEIGDIDFPNRTLGYLRLRNVEKESYFGIGSLV